MKMHFPSLIQQPWLHALISLVINEGAGMKGSILSSLLPPSPHIGEGDL